jgi:tetratricopeptide (TPR) repeat protein
MNQFNPVLTPSTKSARIVGALAMLYHRHNDPARALALGVMALRYGCEAPRTALLVASCFLKTGDAEQALAALSRLDGAKGLGAEEQSAIAFLRAKAQFRLGAYDDARALMAQANQLAPHEADL